MHVAHCPFQFIKPHIFIKDPVMRPPKCLLIAARLKMMASVIVYYEDYEFYFTSEAIV